MDSSYLDKKARTLLNTLNYNVGVLSECQYKLALALVTYFREQRIENNREKVERI